MNARTASEIVYPDADGAPVGETGLHGLAFRYLTDRLADRFAADPRVYVGGNQFLYYVEGDPTQVVCPDVYVCLEHAREPPLDTWKVWQEGGAPTFILELVSPSSRRSDLVEKKALYERLGVQEYAVFDPRREVLRGGLRLWRARDGGYVEVARGPYGWWSVAVDRWLDLDEAEQWRVVLRHADGTVDPSRVEAAVARSEAAEARSEVAEARAEAAEARAAAEAARAEAAEAELVALAAELARLRAERH